ncbi:MAG: ribonuclease III [Pseudomonadota bacterium]
MKDTQNQNDWASLEALIGQKFGDYDLLARAFTHSSARHMSDDIGHYERLEFVGDRVLGLTVAELLWRRFPDASEGELNRRLSALVNGETCTEVADEIGLHKFISTGADVRQITGKRMASVRADVVESLLAVIYLDGGLAAAAKFVERYWGERVTHSTAARRDPKTALQEWAHAMRQNSPIYTIIDRSGPDHDPRFEVQVKLEPVQAKGVAKLEGAVGKGRSKRAAEQDAAEQTLVRHGVWTTA